MGAIFSRITSTRSSSSPATLDGLHIRKSPAQQLYGVPGILQFLGDVSLLVGRQNAARLTEGKGQLRQHPQGRQAAGKDHVKGAPVIGFVGQRLRAFQQQFNVGEV